MINNPFKARFYVPTSLEAFDATAEPTLEDVGGRDILGNTIAGAAQCINAMDGRPNNLLTIESDLISGDDSTFASDTGNYSRDGTVTIAGGKLVFTASVVDDDATITLPLDVADYEVVFEITDYTNGSVRVDVGGIAGTTRSSATTFTETITAGAGATVVIRARTNPTNLSIGDITVRLKDTYRIDTAFNKLKTYSFAILDNFTGWTSIPLAIRRMVQHYFHTSDAFGSSTEATPNVVISGLLGRGRPFYRFDGVDDKVTVGDNANLDFGNGDGSIEAFIIIKDVSADAFWYGRYSGTDQWNVFYDQSAGKLRAYIYQNGYLHHAQATWAPSANTKYHVVFTFVNGSSNALYVDSVSLTLTTDVTTGGDMSIAVDLLLGEQGNGVGHNTMDLEKITIYNRALAPKEIEQMALGYPVLKPLLIGANSDFHTNNDWVNGTLNLFNSDGDLSLTATAAGQWCRIDGTIVPMVVGKEYSLSMDVANVGADAWTVRDRGSFQTFGTITSADNGTTVTFLFTFDPSTETTGGVRFRSSGNSSTGDFDNIYLTDLDTLVTFPLVVDQWGEMAIYTADWSAGADGWTGTRVTVAGNIDAISDGATSKDNCLRMVCSADDNTHYTTKATPGISTSEDQSVDFWYYIPSGQSNVDGFTLTDSGAVTLYDGKSTGSTPATIGEWTLLRTRPTTPGADGLLVQMYDGASNSFIDPVANDIIYFQGLMAIKEGAVAAYLHDGISEDQSKWFDASTNALHGTPSGAEVVDGATSENPGFFLTTFDDVRKLWAFTEFNDDGATAVADSLLGLLAYGYIFEFQIRGDGYKPTPDYPGIQLQESDAGRVQSEAFYGRRDSWTLEYTPMTETQFLSYQEMQDLTSGSLLPLYVIFNNDDTEPVVHRIRFDGPPSVSWHKGSHRWMVSQKILQEI